MRTSSSNSTTWSADIPRNVFEGLTVRLLRSTAGISASVYNARPSLSSPRFSLQAQEHSPDTAGIHINVS